MYLLNKCTVEYLITHRALEPLTLWSFVVPIRCYMHSVNGGAHELSVSSENSELVEVPRLQPPDHVVMVCLKIAIARSSLKIAIAVTMLNPYGTA